MMKRRTLSIVLALLMVLPVCAQSLEGTWSATEDLNEKDASSEAEVKATGTTTYIFSADSFKAEMGAVMDMSGKAESGEAVNVIIKLNGANNGTWSMDGEILTLTPDKKSKPKVTLDFEGMPAILANMLSGPIKKEITKALKEAEQYRVVSLTDSELTLESILSDKQVKEGAKAEITVLKRQ